MSLTNKAVISLALIALATVGVGARAQETSRKIRILGIGNSFTQNSTRYLPAIIKSDGQIQVDVAVAYIGGCPLDRHVALAKINEANPDDPKGKIHAYRVNGKTVLSKASLKEILLDGPWDFITIQQVSHKSYKIETYYPYAQELYDYIKKYAPDAKIVIHETWAHRVDCPRTKQWNLEPAAMYEKLHAAYAKVAGELGISVVPVGTAFEAAKKLSLWNYQPPENVDRAELIYPTLPDQSKSLHSGYYWRKDKEDPEKKTLHMDGFHAGRAGEYLGGLVWYEFFFKKDARSVTFVPKGMTDEQATSLREVTHQVMDIARSK